jgi:hypothetical protein
MRLVMPLGVTAGGLIVAVMGLIVMDPPALASLTVLTYLAVAAACYFARPLRFYFVLALLTLLFGYSVIGRGFAYVAVPRLFVGEGE